MATVGIIANPAAGKDIRRLVAHASTFDNNEKVSIVRRVLLGLEGAGTDEVLFMPDYYGIGTRALRGLELSMRSAFLEMEPEFRQADSTQAAARLRELGVGCIVTLGGDGTNRVVAKGCGTVPLVPISTGTNNVFPRMIEGTIAGLAAGVVAQGIVAPDIVAQPTLRLELLHDSALLDIALIDVVVCAGRFVGARAVWDVDVIRQIISTRARPDTIGFSAIGGYLDTPELGEHEGVALEIGGSGQPVLVPIGPGLLRPLRVQAQKRLAIGETVPIAASPAVLALDGEREITLQPGAAVQVRLSAAGPHVVDVYATLRQAARQGFFLLKGGAGPGPAS